MTDSTDRLLYDPTPRPDVTLPHTQREAELLAEIERLRAALAFYAEHGAGCRLIHSGGDPHRHALQADGGNVARDALEAARKDEGQDD